LINGGRADNRIDVVLMGDGYQKGDDSLFLQDMQRLVKDMWEGGSFDAVLPLYNVWAVFVESKERGIGVGGTPKNTAFGLYRDGTELRGIYPSKPEAARAACKYTGPNACDFPSLIGNDPYYGGLGGEFTIGTSSPTTGSVVLRHEFGHTMIQVGEEYDGGEAYSGCNAARSLKSLRWKKWLTIGESGKGLKEERNAQRIQDYSWYDLEKGVYTLNFTSDGKYDRWYLRITASGVESPGSLQVFLDGVQLPWETRGILDRQFYDWSSSSSSNSSAGGQGGFKKGRHVLQFKQGFPKANASMPIRQLCSVTLHEYAKEGEYHFDPDYVGAFPTYSLSGRKSYRPTHESCLMRNMTSHKFCPVCKEGLFLQLLKTVSLIDAIETKCESTLLTGAPAASRAKYRHTAKVDLLPFAHLRQPIEKRIPGEKYSIQWFENGKLRQDLNDAEEVVVEGDFGKVKEEWSVAVKLETPIVRNDPDNLLESQGRVVWDLC
ncbi:IgA peptidase M64-domain-containing protein, partial [Obelidium mucronatum]